jgi:hypothetical protein
MKNIIGLALLVFLFSCQETKTSEGEKSNRAKKENSPANDVPEAGSMKAKLIGKWSKTDSPAVEVEITSDKYKSYVGGDVNWDQDWDLATAADAKNGTISDNGSFICVYDKGEIFYVERIISLEGNTLHTIVEVGGNAGSENEYTRIE